MPQRPHYEPNLVTAHRFIGENSTDNLSHGKSLVENRHMGWLVVYHLQQGILYSTPGAAEIATFFRSSAKPFQAFPLVKSGLHPQLTDMELALTCASHVGSHKHIDLARSIFKKANLPETALQCGPHAPADAAMREYLRQSEKTPTAIHNNCSGKHAGMIFYCQKRGWDPSTYLQFEHPLQQEILQALRQWGDIEDIPTALDGCGAPVFYLPLKTMALLYAHLGSTEAFAPLCNAMIQHPEIVGGDGRVDTVIMQASQGQLLAKVGADGVLCVSRTGTQEGLALKIADGSELVRNMAIVEILTRLGWLDATAIQDSRLSPFQDQLRFNTQDKVVGEFQIHYPPKPNS